MSADVFREGERTAFLWIVILAFYHQFMLKTSKKNKRGARGSQDDEIIAAKRVLTASSESMADEESEDEPTFTEIWNLLADVRKTVADILKDNKNLREEIAEMKSSIESQRREFSEVKEFMASVKGENEALKSELQQTKEKLQEQTEESQNLMVLSRRTWAVHKKKLTGDHWNSWVLFRINGRGSYKNRRSIKCRYNTRGYRNFT